MKKSLGILVTAIMVLFSTSITAFAGGVPQNSEDGVCYSIDFDDSMLQGATKINEETNRENGRISTITTYILEDGTKIVDTFTRGDNSVTRSANGTDTATRKRDLGDWGSISLTASFSWRTEGLFSYVKCTSASASKSLDSNAVVSTWDITKTSTEVSIGKADASLKYYMYNKQVPVQFQDGTLKITCSDSGTISDNA